MCYLSCLLQGLPQKETIAEAASKCVQDLSNTVSGRFLLHNLRISEYSNSKDAWKKHVTQHKRKRDNFLKEMEIDEEFSRKVPDMIDGRSAANQHCSMETKDEVVSTSVDLAEKEESSHVDIKARKKKRKDKANRKDATLSGIQYIEEATRTQGDDAFALTSISAEKAKKKRKKDKTKSIHKTES